MLTKILNRQVKCFTGSSLRTFSNLKQSMIAKSRDFDMARSRRRKAALRYQTKIGAMEFISSQSIKF